jgi:vancomycin resistance protein YoaR
MSKKAKTKKLAFALTLIIIFCLFFAIFFARSFYQTHFFPQTFINNFDLSNLDSKEALTLLLTNLQISPKLNIILSASQSAIASSSGDLKLSYDLPTPLNDTLAHQNNLPLITFFHRLLFPTPTKLNLQLQYSPPAFDNYLNIFAQNFDQPEASPSLSLVNKQVVIDAGKNGFKVNQAATKNLMLSRLPQQTTFTPIIDSINVAFSPEEINQLTAQAAAIAAKKIILTTKEIDNYQLTLSPAQIIPLLNPYPPVKNKLLKELYLTISEEITRTPQEPELILSAEENKVEKFTPPLDGLTLTYDDFSTLINAGLENLITTNESPLTLNLPLTTTPPITSLTDTNHLGIKELIGFGESYYAHSIPGRIHNVTLTASRINNTLIAPGEEFSFNKTLGEVSNRTGFQAGYIIQGGRSILSDGGGVCQVSTTLFRAVLDAGLNITKRIPHSYRVTYYELDNDPGFDATVYSGEIDFRFINDTPAHLLLTTTADSKTLYMNIKIYGTPDGRTSTITNYQKFGSVAPPPDEYIPDPSLAPGQTKQIDWAVAGLKTTFTHTIYNADGSLRSQKDYPSTYRAWSDKYLVGPSP